MSQTFREESLPGFDTIPGKHFGVSGDHNRECASSVHNLSPREGVRRRQMLRSFFMTRRLFV